MPYTLNFFIYIFASRTQHYLIQWVFLFHSHHQHQLELFFVLFIYSSRAPTWTKHFTLYIDFFFIYIFVASTKTTFASIKRYLIHCVFFIPLSIVASTNFKWTLYLIHLIFYIYILVASSKTKFSSTEHNLIHWFFFILFSSPRPTWTKHFTFKHWFLFIYI